MTRYFISLFVALGLVILVLVLIFGGGKSKQISPLPAPLPNFANSGTVVSLTNGGPITALQNHNSVVISVTQNSTTFNLIQGYDNNVISSRLFPNTPNSYNSFLYALYYAGFTKGDNALNLKTEVGFCPTGNRYVFEIDQDGKVLQRYWDTNCLATPKTFNGNSALTIRLFQVQIPGYNTLVSGANL